MNTRDNLRAPSAGEPIRASWCQTVTEAANGRHFGDGWRNGTDFVQKKKPEPFNRFYIRVKTDTQHTFRALDVVSVDTGTVGEFPPEHFSQMFSDAEKSPLNIITPTEDTRTVAILQEQLLPGTSGIAVIAGLSPCFLHMADSSHKFARWEPGETYLISDPSGPFPILSVEPTSFERNAVTLCAAFVALAPVSPGRLCENLTEGFNLFNGSQSETASMQPTGTNTEAARITVYPQSASEDFTEFPWKLPAGALCRVRNRRVEDILIPDFNCELGADHDGTLTTAAPLNISDELTFNGSHTLTAYLSPSLENIALEAGTKVIANWNYPQGKWFFFKPRAGTAEPLSVVYSGNVFTCTECRVTENGSVLDPAPPVFLKRLNAASVLHSARLKAARTAVEIVGSDGGSPWFKVPVSAPAHMAVKESIRWMNGEKTLMITEGPCFKTTADYGVYLFKDNSDATYRYCGILHNVPCFCTAAKDRFFYEPFVTSDGPRLNTVLGPATGKTTTGNYRIAVGESITFTGDSGGLGAADITLTRINPDWDYASGSSGDIYRKFTNGTDTVVFGDRYYSANYFNTHFISVPDVYGNLDRLKGGLRFTLDNTEFRFTDIRRTGDGPILGTKNDAEKGWFEYRGDTAFGFSTTLNFDFQVVSKPNFNTSAAQILAGQQTFVGNIECSSPNSEYFLKDSVVARWTCSSADLQTSVSFTFHQPEGGTAEAIPTQTYTLAEIITDPDHKSIHVSGARYIIGTDGASSGWLEADETSAFNTSFTFTHGKRSGIQDLVLTFSQYTNSGETAEIILAEATLLQEYT